MYDYTGTNAKYINHMYFYPEGFTIPSGTAYFFTGSSEITRVLDDLEIYVLSN